MCILRVHYVHQQANNHATESALSTYDSNNTETIVFIIFTYVGSQEKREFSSRKIKQIPKNI